MTIALYAVLAYVGWRENEFAKQAREAAVFDPAMLKAVFLTLVQLMIVTATALFFSTFSTPILSAAFTLGVYVAGFFSADLKNFEQVVNAPAAGALARGMYYVLPNLGSFDVAAQVVHGIPVGARYIALTTAYGLVYIAILLTISVAIFSRRDFK
jgi:hypothetical protein